MLLRRLITAAFALLGLFAAVADAQPERPLALVLPESVARARAERISNVRYGLDITIGATAPDYGGTVTVRFDLEGADEALTLDFDRGKIADLDVNGAAVSPDYNEHYLTLPSSALAEGPNTVTIRFTRPYSEDGTGLYRFVDPEDQRVYLYSDFEPFRQNRLFPSFDQPDLKARFTMTVRAPARWQVIANTRETGISDAGDERVWTFPETLPLSTYLLALHAGDYHVWESSAGTIPLRLFARESLVPYVHPEHWFVPTQQGFEFYQRYFEMDYPFGKYDQILVPHFNAGAMENTGAVTFNEGYLERGTVTRRDRSGLANTILHEMAHMWFGDIVTLRWWNGLWLNESFATVMAQLSMTAATEFTDENQQGFRRTLRAYAADERDTTHPIELPVPDTASAFANFDRITYDKGSATLIQLMHLVGPENFRRGVAAYLDANAFGNTELRDFLGAIAEAADMPLDDWADQWLLQPGTNTVAVDYSCADDRITALSLMQTAPEKWPVLRSHRTQLGLYRFTTEGADLDVLPVTYSGAETAVQAAVGRECPDFIYPNHDDWDYVRVALDADTLSLLDGMLGRIEDPLARQMLWESVWDAVRDARMPVSEYVAFALANLGAESDELAIRQVLGSLATSASYIDEIVSDESTRRRLEARIEDFLWDETLTADPGSDLQLTYFDTYVGLATGREAVDRIANLLTGATPPPDGITLDQDRRWAALAAVYRSGRSDAGRLLEAESARDPSDDGHLQALSVAAGRPDPDAKARSVESLLSPEGTGNLAEFRAIARGLYPRGQHALQLAGAKAAIEGLDQLEANHEAQYFGTYMGGLLSPLCDSSYLEALDQAIRNSSDRNPIIQRGLLDSRFETARCLRIADREHATN